MQFLVRPFAAADEEDADHIVEPDERNREVAFRSLRGRSRGARVFLKELSEELEERGREFAPLGPRHGRDDKHARSESQFPLEQRTLVVRQDLPQELERAEHALLGSLRRLQDLRRVVERPAKQLQARGLAPLYGHGRSFFLTFSTGSGSPVRTPRRPLKGDPTSTPFSVKFILRTSVACRTPRAFSTEMPRSRFPSSSTYLSWITLSAANEIPRPESWAEPSRSAMSMFRLSVTPWARKCLVMA